MLKKDTLENKFEDLTPEIVNSYIDSYKDLTTQQLYLIDYITKTKSKDKYDFGMMLDKLFEATVGIEYYEACKDILTIKNKFEEKWTN